MDFEQTTYWQELYGKIFDSFKNFSMPISVFVKSDLMLEQSTSKNLNIIR